MSDLPVDEKVAFGTETNDIANDSNSDIKEFDADAIADKIVAEKGVSLEEHHNFVELLKQTIADHQLDPNFPADILARARSLVVGDHEDLDRDELHNLVAEIEREKELLYNDSPYAEVRAVISPTDDPSIPTNTFRVWFLGTIFTIIGTGLDQFFSARYPGIYIASSVAQFVSYPCGIAMAKYLPTKRFGYGRFSFTLNPGPFSQKEHMLIAVMANVGFGGANGTAYVTSIFQVLKLPTYFNNQRLGNSAGFQLLLALSTQLIGYGIAGVMRRFLVYPSAMIWPSQLAQIALNAAMHNDNGRVSVKGWKISRGRFFTYCFCGMFVYFWFPDYIFQALSYFNWITWISPQNTTLVIITGTICGLGLNPWPTFDWNMLMIDPIMNPFFSVANTAAGMAFVGFFIIPLMYWKNVFNTAYLPINDNVAYDNTGNYYNVSRILNPDFTLNVEAYEAYSVPYLSAANAVLYSAFFGVYLATIVYAGLYYWKDIKTGIMAAIKWKNARDDYKDVHNRLMKVYKEVPEWWYLTVLVISIVLSIIVCEVYHTGMPVWGIFFAVAMNFLLQLPIGMVTAVTNMEVTNNVLAEFIAGYAIPNKVIANMIFKSYGYIAAAQSIQFVADLKMGHYLKIAPRVMFSAQVYATIIAAFVSVGVNAWQMSNISGFCTSEATGHFTCPDTNTFFTAAVIWGVVGPKRMYGAGGLYNALEWGFLVGALLPVPFWYLAKKFPNSWVRYIHIPVFLSGMLYWSPYSFAFMWPSVILGWVFNSYIKRNYLAWWQKYAYVLTTAFQCGVAISGIVIFFAVQYHEVDINWWGNTVSYSGMDGEYTCQLRQVPDSGKFPGT